METLRDRLNSVWFRFMHGRNLVYNTCWEDPRLDRAALQLRETDRLLMITSAGCNALDYALQGPHRVYAVDLNPRQNALLELKLAGIKRLDYETFFALFGRGRLANAGSVYQMQMRDELSPRSQKYWDRHMNFFEGDRWQRSFYFRGTSGSFAKMINGYIDRVAKVRHAINDILAAPNVAEQRRIYDTTLRSAIWTRAMRFAVGRDMTLSLLGVPRPQRHQIDRDYPGGIVKFIEDCLEAVFAELPLSDNYFWRVYLTGEYTAECCPEYLKPDNFARLKAGLADRIQTHTCSVTDFLCDNDVPITRFVLLDHMDWLSTFRHAWLQQEWQAIVDRAAPGARLIWRSGGLRTDFVDRVKVNVGGQRHEVRDLLHYNRELADELHPRDRVHTYGSFWIADLKLN